LDPTGTEELGVEHGPHQCAGGTVLLTVGAAAGIIQNVVDVPDQIMARGSGQTGVW